jgi:anti-sigma factor RsiW
METTNYQLSTTNYQLMTHDQLEFAISQYLDGTLPAEEKAALERCVASDAAARRMLEEHVALHQLLQAEEIPAVQWDRLARRISDALGPDAMTAGTNSGGGDAEVPDELEYLIMQYVDGELDAEERAAFERRIAADPAARQVLAQHRSLEAVLRHSWAMPHVDFERLGEHLGEAVAPSSYSITSWVRYGSMVAVAACVLIVASLSVHFALRGSGGKATVAANGNTGATVPTVARTPLMQVAIGPAALAGKSQLSVGIVASDEMYDDGGVVASARAHIEVDEMTPAVSDDGFFMR